MKTFKNVIGILFLLFMTNNLIGQQHNAIDFVPGNDKTHYQYNPENGSRGAYNILIYADDVYHSPSYIDLALQNLGLTYTAFYYGNYSGFTTALSGGGWDLVIFGHENAYYSSSVLDALNNYVVQGGCLLMADFESYSFLNHPLWNNLGFNVGGEFFMAFPVYWLLPQDSIFNCPNYQVPEVLNPGSGYTRDHVWGTALSGTTVLGEIPYNNLPTFFKSNNGRTIFRGWLDGTWNGDENNNNVPDGVELWENMIANSPCIGICAPPVIPLSNWALGIAIFLIVAATLIRIRRFS